MKVNPYKKVLVARGDSSKNIPYGIGIEIRVDGQAGIPESPVYEPTPENARSLIKDCFPLWEFLPVFHDPEVLQLAYTTPDGAKKIYGSHW